MNSKITKLIVSAAALFAVANLCPAQNMSVSGSYSKTWGNSKAGISIYANAYGAAGRSSRYVSSTGTGFVLAPHWETTYAGSASGKVYADLRFLGETRRAGYFRMNLGAAAVKKTYSGGRYSWGGVSSGGSTYLKVGGTVLWNSSFVSYFIQDATMRIRISTPTLVVPMGAGVAALKGRAYARVRAQMDGTFNPFAGQVKLNGEAAVSGDGYASATVISLLLFANTSLSFYANEQKLDANSLTIAPGLNPTTTWGRSGNIRVVSGSMRGLIKLNAALPPYIPISTTLANWSRSTTTKTLF